MFLTEIEKFNEYIHSYQVEQFEQNGTNLRFRMSIVFKNGSQLFVKEIIINGVKRKYAYHWVNRYGGLICRWDNAPDWPEIETFPHHRHVKKENRVEASENIEFSAILNEIILAMRKHN